MSVPRFSDEQWSRIYAFLLAYPGLYVLQEQRVRAFVETVLWMLRAGAPWRLVPRALGSWNSVYRRFGRWEDKGVWQALAKHLAADADLEWAMIDSTVVRAHACAAGAARKKGPKRSGGHAAASRPSSMRSATRSAILTASP